MKRLLILFMFICGISHATDTFLRVENGKLVVVDGVIQTGAADVGWTDTSPYLKAIWYMDDLQPTPKLTTSTGNSTDTDMLPAGGASETEAVKWNGLERGYYFPRVAPDETYFSNTNVASAVGAAATNMAWGAWVKPAINVSQSSFFTLGVLNGTTLGEFGLILRNADLWRSINNTWADTGINLTTNRQFLVYSWDGADAVVYLDGSPVYTNAFAGTLDGTGQPYNLGAFFSAGWEYKGDMNKPFFYSGTYLTASDVSDLYALGESGFNLDGIGTNGLVAYYPMTNNLIRINNKIDAGVYTKNANLFGSPTYANSPTMRTIAGTNSTGRVLYVADVDGVDDFFRNADMAVMPSPTNDAILSVWCYFNDTTDGHIAGWVSGNKQFLLQMFSTKIYFSIGPDGSAPLQVISDATPSTGQWIHIAARYQHGGESSLWINNVKQADTETNSTAFDSISNFNAGGNGAGSTVDMLLGTIRWYDGTADTSIITDIYNNTAPPNGDIEIRKEQE